MRRDELAHYAKACCDVEYHFPFGWSELEGIANRTDFDLKQHSNHSGKSLAYFDEETKQHYFPYVIEPAAGADRATLAFLVDSYEVEGEGKDARTVLRLHPALAPIKAAVLPLVKRDGMPEKAEKIYADLLDELGPVVLRSRLVDRPALRAPGRGGHAVLHHRRQPDAAGRYGHHPRARLARAVPRRISRSGRSVIADKLKEAIMMTVRVNVVMGGPSAEHEVSLRSGLEVMANIDKQRYRVRAVVVSRKKEFFCPRLLKHRSRLR